MIQTVNNMKDNLYDWCARKLGINYIESKKFINSLMKWEFAFNVFMQDYYNYLTDRHED